MSVTTLRIVLIIMSLMLAATLGLLVWLISRTSKLEAKYKKFMRNSEGLSSIEDVIFRNLEENVSLRLENYLKKAK